MTSVKYKVEPFTKIDNLENIFSMDSSPNNEYMYMSGTFRESEPPENVPVHVVEMETGKIES
jgi:hypothetical protein